MIAATLFHEYRSLAYALICSRVFSRLWNNSLLKYSSILRARSDESLCFKDKTGLAFDNFFFQIPDVRSDSRKSKTVGQK